MKTVTALCALTLVGLAGCASASDGDSSSADSNFTGAPAAASGGAIAVGDYVLENASVGATLTIKAATANSVSYSLGILGKTGSHHNGELEDRTAKGSGATFDDAVEGDCKISLKAAGADAVEVKQAGPCSDAGFGAFLDGSGTYKKKAGAKPSGFVGLYEHETTHRSWAIRVTSDNPFTFRLVAGHLDDKSERVDAKNLVGTVVNGSILFEHGPNCSIVFAKSELGLHVTQEGLCDKIGFPENDDLSMSDDSGVDFSKLDEGKECFDIKELSVGVSKSVCKSPL